MSRREQLHREWEERLAEFESSGEPATSWCASREINIHRFRYWSSKLRGSRGKKQGEGIHWLSFDMESSTVPAETALMIKVGLAKIEVSEGFSPTLLKQVVQTLADAW